MQYEKLRYQPNKVSQTFTLLGLVFMSYALFKVINVYRYVTTSNLGIIEPKIILGIEILVSIFVMLLSFLASEKVSTYDKNWLWVGVGLTIYPIVKIFLLPISLYKQFNTMIEAGETIKYNPTSWLIVVIVTLVISSLCYAYGTYVNYVKTRQLDEYLKELND